MAENSSIEWTRHTFNGWRGCSKCSAGCAHCYAEADAKRFPKNRGIWGPNGTRIVKVDRGWYEPKAWELAAIRARERHRVFTASLADVFEVWDGPMHDDQGRRLWLDWGGRWIPGPDVEPTDYRDTVLCRPLTMEDCRWRLMGRIESTPNLDWLVLTKRVAHAREWLARWIRETGDPFPLNYRQGASVEDQAAADERLGPLLQIPCPNFLSVEPLLGPIRFDPDQLRRIDWVIVGGESGLKARPMHPDWARSIRDQCSAAGVPFFFKQWGEWAPCWMPGPHTLGPKERRLDLSGRDVSELPGLWDDSDVAMIRVGKEAAGRLLDGVLHDAFPAALEGPIR